jgi:hypothetical protein
MKSAIRTVLVSLMALSPCPAFSAQSEARDGTPPAYIPPDSEAALPQTSQDRASYFIGNTIQNLRGLDPAFGGRTLTLIDGRRVRPDRQPAPPSLVLRALDLPAGWHGPRVSHRRVCGAEGCLPGGALVKHLGDGTTRPFFVNVVGYFVALPRSAQIVDCASGPTAARPEAPSIIDLNGTQTPLLSHPAALAACAATGNGDQVLLTYFMEEGGARITLARVFNADGRLLAEGRFRSAGILRFRADGRRYSAAVPAP